VSTQLQLTYISNIKKKSCPILKTLPIIIFFWNILPCQLAFWRRVKQSKQKDKNLLDLLGSEAEGTAVLQYVRNYIPVDKA
jgi:hypothetical protein